MATERKRGTWEIPSPVRRDLGCGIDRNIGSQIREVQLLYLISRAVVLITHATQGIFVIDAGDLGIRFIACFTGLGVWKPGFLSLDSDVDFLDNVGELYPPTFRVWQPEVQCPDSWSAQKLDVGIPPTTYRVCFVNREVGPSSVILPFLNCC